MNKGGGYGAPSWNSGGGLELHDWGGAGGTMRSSSCLVESSVFSGWRHVWGGVQSSRFGNTVIGIPYGPKLKHTEQELEIQTSTCRTKMQRLSWTSTPETLDQQGTKRSEIHSWFGTSTRFPVYMTEKKSATGKGCSTCKQVQPGSDCDWLHRSVRQHLWPLGDTNPNMV